MSKNLDDLRETAIIDIIVSARYYVKILKDSKEVILCLVHPYCSDRLYSEFVYEMSYDEAIDLGILSRDELEKIIQKRGLITKEDRQREEELVKQIHGLETLFDKMRFAKDKKDKVKENIARLNSELLKLRLKFNKFQSLTAESIANEAKINHLCWSSCYTKLGISRYWGAYSAFDLEENLNFKSEVVGESLSFLIGFSEKTLRKLARSSEWRIRYMSSLKATFPLFSRKPEDYTKDQIALMYWSNFYQSIYEMLSDDRPSNDIIENDNLLDVYMEDYYKGLEQDRLVSSNSRARGTNAFDRDEVIVTRFNELYDKLEYDTPQQAGRNKEATELTIRNSGK
jgi:hypothetical protein